VQGALTKQAAVHAALTHRNVVRFWGTCVDPPLLVTEKCSSSIYKLLDRARQWMRMDDDYFLVGTHMIDPTDRVRYFTTGAYAEPLRLYPVLAWFGKNFLCCLLPTHVHVTVSPHSSAPKWC
jgi:hypothetical protein